VAGLMLENGVFQICCFLIWALVYICIECTYKLTVANAMTFLHRKSTLQSNITFMYIQFNKKLIIIIIIIIIN